jgi:hypothetical protein
MALILSLILVTPLDGLVLKKVSRELQESLLVVFGIKEWEDRLLLPKTFGGENFIQDSRMNQQEEAKDGCNLHSGCLLPPPGMPSYPVW